MTLSLTKISHILTTPHSGKEELLEQETCSISRGSFFESAKSSIEKNLPYVMVYVVDKKKLGSFYDAGHYTCYVDVIRRFVRCENSQETVVMVHYLVVKNLQVGVELQHTYDDPIYEKTAFGRMFTLACSFDATKEIGQARREVIPTLLKKDPQIAYELLKLYVRDVPEDSFAYKHLAALEKVPETAAEYNKKYMELRQKEIKKLPCTLVQNNKKNILSLGFSSLIYSIPEIGYVFSVLWLPHAPFLVHHLGKSVYRLYELFVQKKDLPPVGEYPTIFGWVKEDIPGERHVNIPIPVLDDAIEDEDFDSFMKLSMAVGHLALLTKEVSTRSLFAPLCAIPSLITLCNKIHKYILEKKE